MDWMRNWIFAVRFDENENYKRMEAFMPLTGDFRRPIDMDITPDGIMYVLEYGTVYGADNDDARLIRVDSQRWQPCTRCKKLQQKTRSVLTPLKVSFDSKNSYDNDEDDQLKYEWIFEEVKVASTDAKTEYTFCQQRVYKVTLKVTDPSGLSSTDTMTIKAGNTAPVVNISTTGNSSFYFDATSLDYAVDVKIREDAGVDPQKLQVNSNTRQKKQVVTKR